LLDPPLLLRYLAPQFGDLLLVVLHAHSHTQLQFTPINAVNNYGAKAA
jgi:hypothetical protein